MNEQWIKVDYWAVFEREDSDVIVFEGSKTEVQRYAKKHKMIAAHVICEVESTSLHSQAHP